MNHSVAPEPDVDLPPPPEPIARPATPRVAANAIDESLTIDVVSWDAAPKLGPPPAGNAVSEAPVWVERDREPRLLNKEELLRIAGLRYPPMLRDAGVRATVGVYFYVSETGEVANAVVQVPSGYAQFDRVVLEVARLGEFEPARVRIGGHSSGVKTEPAVGHAVVFQSSASRIFTIPPRHWMEAQPAPEIILKASTRRTRGRSSLLSPRPRCPGAVTRLDSSGKVSHVARATDLAGSLPIPTLKSPCFQSPG